MLYFYEKFQGTQYKIEKNEGKIIRIRNLTTTCFIDFGFKGYSPSSIPMHRIRDTIYLDNLYDITTDGLVKGEELYLYIYSENRNEPIIDYFGKNINYKNNEYNIFYIDENIDDSEDNQNILIINNYNEKNSIIGNVYLERYN